MAKYYSLSKHRAISIGNDRWVRTIWWCSNRCETFEIHKMRHEMSWERRKKIKKGKSGFILARVQSGRASQLATRRLDLLCSGWSERSCSWRYGCQFLADHRRFEPWSACFSRFHALKWTSLQAKRFYSSRGPFSCTTHITLRITHKELSLTALMQEVFGTLPRDSSKIPGFLFHRKLTLSRVLRCVVLVSRFGSRWIIHNLKWKTRCDESANRDKNFRHSAFRKIKILRFSITSI